MIEGEKWSWEHINEKKFFPTCIAEEYSSLTLVQRPLRSLILILSTRSTWCGGFLTTSPFSWYTRTFTPKKKEHQATPIVLKISSWTTDNMYCDVGVK